jgi:hypothetical protein
MSPTTDNGQSSSKKDRARPSTGLLSDVKNFLFSFNVGVGKEVSSFLTSACGKGVSVAVSLRLYWEDVQESTNAAV